jgi:hypothetical protein
MKVGDFVVQRLHAWGPPADLWLSRRRHQRRDWRFNDRQLWLI